MSFEPDTVKTYGWPVEFYEHHFTDAGNGKIYLDGHSIDWIGFAINVFVIVISNVLFIVGAEYLFRSVLTRNSG